ncbi:MAG: hypothetical protein ACM3JD_01840 [Rudaea sp.]
MKPATKHPRLVWSAKVILILSLAVIVTVTALVFALSDRSVLVETGITLSVIAVCLFVFLTTGLYLGVHLERVNRKEIDQVIKRYQERGTERPEPASFDMPRPDPHWPDPAPPGRTGVYFPAGHPPGMTGSFSGGGSASRGGAPELPSLNSASAGAFSGLNFVSDGLFSILNGTFSSIGGAFSFGGGGGGGGGGGSGFGGDGGGDGGGCGDDLAGLVVGIIVAILAVVAFAILIWLLAQFFAALPVFIAVLFWIFYRALRVVFARSHACQGRLLKSAGFGLLYTVLYTSWTFILLFIVGMLAVA